MNDKFLAALKGVLSYSKDEDDIPVYVMLGLDITQNVLCIRGDRVVDSCVPKDAPGATLLIFLRSDDLFRIGLFPRKPADWRDYKSLASALDQVFGVGVIKIDDDGRGGRVTYTVAETGNSVAFVFKGDDAEPMLYLEMILFKLCKPSDGKAAQPQSISDLTGAGSAASGMI